jgi:hypothetical protein
MRAMKPSYSKLLLNEQILPDMNCPSFFAASDITMMAVLTGMERSRKQWMELLESVGLKVIHIWQSPDKDDCEGIIEAIVE